MNYTISNIPDEIDRAIRARATVERKSPEQAILDAVARDLGISVAFQEEHHPSPIATTCPHRETTLEVQNRGDPKKVETLPKKRRDLSDIAGKGYITPEMEKVFEEQRRIDPELWK